MKPPIKLFFINGYLGSGKTTFLNNLLASIKDCKVGLLVNDFGRISIDGAIFKAQDRFTVSELSNGSIFCSCLKGSFLMELVRFSHLPLDMLFIESTGLADPSNIGSILSIARKLIGSDYNYCGSICLIDAENFLEQLDILVAVEKQVVYADMVLINKIDIVDAQRLDEIETRVRQLNSLAQVRKTSYAKIPEGFIDEDFRSITLYEAGESSNKCNNKPPVFKLEAQGVFGNESLIDFLKSLAGKFYRMKGFFNLEDGWKQIDVVGGRIDIKPTKVAGSESRMVFISDDNRVDASKGSNIISMNWTERFTQEMDLKVD